VASGINALDKALTLTRTISNWPLVALDKTGAVGTCRYRTRGGARFVCRSRSTDINEVVVVMSGREYPVEYLRLAPDAVVFDIGANIGSFAVLVESLNRDTPLRGYAFEPFADNFDLLLTNLDLNGTEHFQCHQVAIAGHDGAVHIDTSVQPDAVRICDDGAGVSVPAVRLSTFCRDNGIGRIDLLKIDAEGAEYPMLQADHEFFRTSVATALMEYHRVSDEHDLPWIVEKLQPDFEISYIHQSPSCGVLHLRNTNLT